MTFEEALSALAALAPRGWRMGLDRMEAFASLAGLSDSLGSGSGPRFIHVAGTNGKGSVTAYLQSLLVEQEYRTGAFFSPYVYDPRERVQLNRNLISRIDFARITESLLKTATKLEGTDFGGITEFEIKTALGFAFFAEQECEWVALEVGLGGRLDATNIVTPRASVIVSIGLDHMNILGNSIEEIAFEKAGVCKRGVPLVLGKMPSGASKVILKVAKEVGSPVWEFGKEIQLISTGSTFEVRTPLSTFPDLSPSLVGVHQPHNMALAVSALEVSGALRDSELVSAGVAQAVLPGRFEQRTWRGRTWILDGAHNLDSAKAVVETLRTERPNERVLLVSGMLTGHEPCDFYQVLSEVTDRAIFVPVDFHRTRRPEDLLREVGDLFSTAEACEDVERAIDRSIELTAEGSTILITGSFYLVGEAGELLLQKTQKDARVPK